MTSSAVSPRLVRPNAAAPRRIHGAWADGVFHQVTRGSALLVFAILAGILISLLIGAWPALKQFGLTFVFRHAWDPVQDDFGALAPIIGTLLTSLVALLIAVPVSLGIALYLTELAPRVLRRSLGTLIELLAAIPSIIYGMWGLFVFVPLFAEYVQPWLTRLSRGVPLLEPLFSGPPMGVGVLTAGIVLSIMVIPFIASVARDVFMLVPPMLKESAYALGATTWEVVWRVVLPYTSSGVIGGIMLGLGRALGETMAVTFVIGNSHRLSVSLLTPGNSIASTLANEFAEAVGEMHYASLMALGLMLFLITTMVLFVSRLLLARLRLREGTSS